MNYFDSLIILDIHVVSVYVISLGCYLFVVKGAFTLFFKFQMLKGVKNIKRGQDDFPLT